jgi:hypothetical protein
MPVIRVRLEDPSGEWRSAAVAADTQDEAVAVVEALEAKRTAFLIDPSEAKELERKLREGSLSGREKARLLTHRQERPYKVVKAGKGG